MIENREVHQDLFYDTKIHLVMTIIKKPPINCDQDLGMILLYLDLEACFSGDQLPGFCTDTGYRQGGIDMEA